MALEKQNLNIPFSQGLDTKSDNKQLSPGKFLELQNTVFNKGGLLQKRNGFGSLTELDDPTLNTLTTFNGNLTAIGESLYAFSQDTNQWVNKGEIASVQLSTLPLVRNSSSQQSIDVALATNGLCCVVWKDADGFSKYRVTDSTNGQVIVETTNLETGAALPRVFLLGQYFFITYLIDVGLTTHMRFITISTSNVSSVTSPSDITTQVDSISAAYDGQIVDGQLYLAWNASTIGGAVKIMYYDQFLAPHLVHTLAGQDADRISICGDTTVGGPYVWLSFVTSGGVLKTIAYDNQLNTALALTTVASSVTVSNLTSYAQNSVNTIFYAIQNTYSYSSTRSDYLRKVTVTLPGVVGTPSTILRSVALASKANLVGSKVYMLVAYGGAYQPTYFLIDENGNCVGKLAYSNGGGYPSTQILSNSIVNGNDFQVGYQFKDQIIAVNKDTNITNVGGLYSQLGLNLATFTVSNSVMPTAEIGGARHFASGFLWMYDGVKPVEHSFHVWPEDIEATTSNSGGSMTNQVYYYQVTYEWTDASGNVHRSAPSIAVLADLSGGSPSSNKVTLDIPTYRVTYKTNPNPVRIVIYRWSEAQQSFYQVTSITSPLLNDTSVDSVQYVDTQADSAILGNSLIYTTGGVIENIAAPACNGIALFKSRLFLIDAEDPNLIWYSKLVIENTPVEMSDLLTIFVAPTTGAQGSTGECTVLSAMDDKLIIFKPDAIYYVTGQGPDNTGGNNNFSDPIFITSTVGSSNDRSITFVPAGIMFQSDKGIWLLGRDLSTNYIGAPVDDYNSFTVNSALTIPGTNQVRFSLDGSVTLMFDYFYLQWGTFTNIPTISATLYEGMHTYLNTYGQVFQETQDTYLDGTSPVLISFRTGWFNMAGLQGFERAYFFYLLGQYISPHKLQIGIAYDYNENPVQTSTVMPDNYSPAWGGDTLWGSSSPWGGLSNIEQWRVFLQRQKCQAFQIIVNEIYDSSIGIEAGAGLTLSGINLVLGAKGTYPRLAPKYSVG